MNTKGTVFAVAIAAVTLAACGGGEQETTAVQEAPTTSAPQATRTTTVTETAREQETTQAPDTAQEQAAAPVGPMIDEPVGLSVGQPVNVYGEQGTVCAYGDGFAVNTLAAGANTSCDFALATFNELTQGLNPTYDNVRDILPTSVVAHSPVTGQDYSMSCEAGAGHLVTCRGGNNAAVYLR